MESQKNIQRRGGRINSSVPQGDPFQVVGEENAGAARAYYRPPRLTGLKSIEARLSDSSMPDPAEHLKYRLAPLVGFCPTANGTPLDLAISVPEHVPQRKTPEPCDCLRGLDSFRGVSRTTERTAFA